MPSTTTLYRPTGIHEMALIIQTSLKEFPPRLPHQPIFYPVLTLEYVIQIARDWNAPSDGHAGFVTRFEQDVDYAAQFEEHVVGSASVHREFWVPGETLAEFNRHIVGLIHPIRAFFSDGYEGPPPRADLAGLSVPGQFERLAALAKDNPSECLRVIEGNWDVILLNFAWWAAHGDFSPDRLNDSLRAILAGWRTLRARGVIPDIDLIGADLLGPA